MISLFQTAAGAWHWPSILAVLGWLVGSSVTGLFLFATLRVNRDDRVKVAAKEQAAKIASDAAAEAAARRIADAESELRKAKADLAGANERVTKLEEKTSPKTLAERLTLLLDNLDELQGKILSALAASSEPFLLLLIEMTPHEASELRRLCAEDSEHKYVTLLPPENDDATFALKDNGMQVTQIRLKLNKALLSDTQTKQQP